jgi:hypothetical protein
VGKPRGRLRRRSVNNIRMDLRELGWSNMDWTDLAQGNQWRTHVNKVINIQVL